MGELEQANKSPSQALFTLFNALSNKEKESFVTKFAHDVFHVKVLIRPDGTVLIPNEETAKVLEESERGENHYSFKTKDEYLKWLESDEDED